MNELRRSAAKDDPELARIDRVLASATIVEPQTRHDVVTLGAAVTLESGDGQSETFRVVGVDEVDLHPENVAWVSPLGRALLGAELGQRVALPGEEKDVRTVVRIS
jgi:transcription elongation factor GreB